MELLCADELGEGLNISFITDSKGPEIPEI
jgi:hypothetical protein